MPEVSPFAMLSAVIERGLQAMRLAVPQAAPDNPAIAAVARKALKTITTNWETVDDAIDNAAGEVALVMNDPQFTPQTQISKRDALVASARAQAMTGLATIDTALANLVDTLRKAALPARPTPADAVQEAVIAGLKTDLRMLLDGTATMAVPQEILDLVARYSAAGDALAVWVLVVSGWPELYMRSRGIDETFFTRRVSQVLAELGGDSATMNLALELLSIAEGPHGMLGSVAAMKASANMALDELVHPTPANYLSAPGLAPGRP